MNSNYKDYYNNFGSLKFEKKKMGTHRLSRLLSGSALAVAIGLRVINLPEPTDTSQASPQVEVSSSFPMRMRLPWAR